jgi:diguanylate cyclase (GGDEF)-like protein
VGTSATDAMASAIRPGLSGPVRQSLLPRQLSPEEFAAFAGVGERRELRRGEIIFRRGELGRSMFLLESGEVQLAFGDGMAEKLIGAREFFGELTLFIGNHARVASAMAHSPCVLYVIGHAAFETLLEQQPALLAQFMRRSFSYLVTSEQQLIANLKRRNEDLMVTLDSLRRTESELNTVQRLVRTDELTGLCNRRGLYMFLEQFEEHRLAGTRLALLLIDLDHFKQINDRCGHLVGDQVLRAVAEEVQDAALPCDLPCRLGGDEFALVTQVTGLDELQTRARQILAGVRGLRLPGCSELSVSIGGTLCPDGSEWASWYSHADVALYEVKAAGGDDWRVLAP